TPRSDVPGVRRMQERWIMPKRAARQATRSAQPANPASVLRQALVKRTKDELIAALLEAAEENRQLFRQLEARFEVETPLDQLIESTHLAISDATHFDKRDMNRNFAYDYAAYAAVKKNFNRLIAARELPAAMELALELMSQ